MKTMQKYPELIAGLSGFLFTLFLMGVSGIIVTWFFVDDSHIISGVHIQNIDVSGLTTQEASQKLQTDLPQPETFTLTLQRDQQSWASTSAQLNWQPQYDQAAKQALEIGRTGNIWQQSTQRLILLWQPTNLELRSQFDESMVREWLQRIAQEIDKPGQAPHVVVSNSQFQVERGEKGEVVDQEKMVAEIKQRSQTSTLPLQMMSLHQPLTDDEITASKQRFQKLWGKTLSLSISELEPVQDLSAKDYFPWIQLPEGYDSAVIQQKLGEWNTQYARQPQDAKLEIDENKKVTLFQAPLNGRAVETEESQRQIQTALSQLENSTDKNAKIELAFSTVEPQTTLAETNDLGIKERIGLGTSTFFHSIPNRVYNVNLTSERVNNALVAPGEEFSFNKVVGEISSRTGYKAAYVIRNGRTELGDGGGVCQVSTTVFRAALDAGFPISAWKAHSYRVGYYEQNSQPGYDATVYAPSADFRFTNNTDHFILISSQVDLDNLFMRVEIWGTDDGRESTISDYSFGKVRPAPAPLYQIDPTLAPGKVKQVDWAAAGGTASFHYSVKDAQGNETFQRTFTSVYKPWQAVYLVGPTQ